MLSLVAIDSEGAPLALKAEVDDLKEQLAEAQRQRMRLVSEKFDLERTVIELSKLLASKL